MNYIDIVFDGPPSHESGRFVEVENAIGASISVGRWLQRDDGYWVLRLHSIYPNDKKHYHVAGTTIGKHIDECAICGHDIRHEVHAYGV